MFTFFLPPIPWYFARRPSQTSRAYTAPGGIERDRESRASRDSARMSGVSVMAWQSPVAPARPYHMRGTASSQGPRTYEFLGACPPPMPKRGSDRTSTAGGAEAEHANHRHTLLAQEKRRTLHHMGRSSAGASASDRRRRERDRERASAGRVKRHASGSGSGTDTEASADPRRPAAGRSASGRSSGRAERRRLSLSQWGAATGRDLGMRAWQRRSRRASSLLSSAEGQAEAQAEGEAAERRQSFPEWAVERTFAPPRPASRRSAANTPLIQDRRGSAVCDMNRKSVFEETLEDKNKFRLHTKSIDEYNQLSFSASRGVDKWDPAYEDED